MAQTQFYKWIPTKLTLEQFEVFVWKRNYMTAIALIILILQS